MEAEYVEFVYGPIDVAALARRLRRGPDGAVVIFEGIVRDNSAGRATLFLEYEAYEAMALEQMRALAREARERWPIDRIAVVHRLGRLEIGETSIAIVVTSAHRGPAFDACRHVIDRVKKGVPIWKKEHFADGAVWVEGEVLQP
jgi:molybdopterin synthase catalytic subunit